MSQRLKSTINLHKARPLASTADACLWLLWMQQQLIGVRRLKMVLVQRLESAWLLVGREKIASHLLDVLEKRIAHIDHAAMQNLIDVEAQWLLGGGSSGKRVVIVVVKRGGGGWRRQ